MAGIRATNIFPTELGYHLNRIHDRRLGSSIERACALLPKQRYQAGGSLLGDDVVQA